MDKGCFNWYLKNSGDFVTSMARSIQLADEANLARISLAFPQMVAAHKCDSWDTVPEGFGHTYNAETAGCDLCTKYEGVLIFPVKTEDTNFCMKCGHTTQRSL